MRNDLGDFRVNVPRMLRLRGSLSNLAKALVAGVTAGFLDDLTGTSDQDTGLLDDAQQCLGEHNLVVDDSADGIGLTRFGNGLLIDDGSHFEDFMLRAHETRGYGRARNRIEGLANGVLSIERLSAQVTTLIAAMLSRLDRRATTVGGRRQWLAGAIEWLSEIVSAIENESDANSQRRATLETDLANSQRIRIAQTATSANPRFAQIRNKLRSLLKNPQPERFLGDNSDSIRRDFERELLRVTLRETLLLAERSLFSSLISTLREEETRNERAVNDLSNASRSQRTKAQTAEVSRGWNVAAGELTLNDGVLTAAVMDYLWEDRSGLWQSIRSGYLESKGQDIFVATEGIFHETDFDDIERVVSDRVAEAIRDWTLVDVIAARCQAGDDLTGTVLEAFRQVASREFLTVGYDQFLPHRTYAIIAYAQSRNARANSIFDGLLQEVTRVVDAEVDIENDHLDDEAVTFYIEDQSVPITAIEFFAKARTEYDASNIRSNPLYTPHPDIYGAILAVSDRSAQPGSGVATNGLMVEEASSGNGHHARMRASERIRMFRKNLREARREHPQATG